MSVPMKKPDAALPALSVEQAEALHNVREAVAENLREPSGLLLRFKQGSYVFGEEKKKLTLGTKLVAVVQEARHGQVKWVDKKVDQQLVGCVVDGFRVPPRETLNDLDADTWPLGPDGRPRDPWQQSVFLPLTSLDGSDVYMFTSASHGGRKAFYKLLQDFERRARFNPSRLPVIQLGSAEYNNRKFGNRIAEPTFDIVSWADRPEDGQAGAAAFDEDAATAVPDMDDEIPW
jgi:hypothetical protein